jgi:DNA-directed RNA polymerase specialized sigma24 family protein
MHGRDVAFLHRLAESFNRTERTILALHFGEQLTPAEVGLVLELSERDVTSTIASMESRTRDAVLAYDRAHAAV